MKTLLISALIASASVAGVASADVGSGTAAAIAHFNQDYDSRGDIISLADTSLNGVTVSTRSGDLAGVFAHFNSDYDGRDDVRGQVGATTYAGNTLASDVFAQIKAEGLENE